MASRQRLMTVFSKVADAGHPHCAHAERLISRAAAELVARPSPGRFVSCASPIRLSSAGDGAVSVAIDTPAEVNAAGLLQHLIEYDDTHVWRLVSEQPALRSIASQHVYSVTLSAGSLDASLEIPHNSACPASEHKSASSAALDQAAKTRLLPGELRFTAPQLSMSQSRLITSCAQQVLLGVLPSERAAAADSPLAVLRQVVQSLPAASPHPPPPPPSVPSTAAATAASAAAIAAATRPLGSSQAHGKKTFHTLPSAERASAAHAAAWGPMRTLVPASPPAAAGGASERGALPSGPLEAVDFLQAMGALVAQPPERSDGDGGDGDGGGGEGGGGGRGAWDALAGAAEVRQQVEEALLLPLTHPAAYAAVLAGTRRDVHGARHDRPAAFLFYGPPGTGKTSAAKIAAAQARLPLVYAPLESLVSRWFGRSEQQLAALFDGCDALGRRVLSNPPPRPHLDPRPHLNPRPT